MGLFKSKKAMPKVSDIFSDEDLQQIRDVIGPKIGTYKTKYEPFASHLMDITREPEREYSKTEWNSIIFAAGCFTKLEKQMAPMLNEAIRRYKDFNKT